MTDAGILALVAGCRQLQSIDLANCHNVTDVGVSALRAGYVKLQITDQGGRRRDARDGSC